jgi:CheY-like chemotaxis protein
VFWNLLSNAVKFTPKGGHVQVVLQRVDSHVQVSVTDTGQGIAPEFLPHVFDRFRQADASTTRQHGGLGLGLSIVKQLVELHGGRVHVTSAGVGQGSTFVVRVPLVIARPESSAEREHQHERQAASVPADLHRESCVQLRGVRVLVVDDEADARAVVQRVLEDCGAVVKTASSAAEAWDVFQSERPDVLVSDIGMPMEDGYTLMKRVRRLGRDKGGNTPSVALTAYARPEDRMKAVRAGFHMHIVKPVEPVELVTMVASLAGRGLE